MSHRSGYSANTVVVETHNQTTNDENFATLSGKWNAAKSIATVCGNRIRGRNVWAGGRNKSIMITTYVLHCRPLSAVHNEDFPRGSEKSGCRENGFMLTELSYSHIKDKNKMINYVWLWSRDCVYVYVSVCVRIVWVSECIYVFLCMCICPESDCWGDPGLCPRVNIV